MPSQMMFEVSTQGGSGINPILIIEFYQFTTNCKHLIQIDLKLHTFNMYKDLVLVCVL